jgi:hypothetical protein
MPLISKWVCGCIPYVPMVVEGEETGLCSICSYVYDERLYAMRLRQHWSNPDNPIPEGVEDLGDILQAIDPAYRAAM